MSYIRSTSNPEGLYIYTALDDKDRPMVHVHASNKKHRLKNFGSDGDILLIPPKIFTKAVKLWDQEADHEIGVKHEGLSVREVFANPDTLEFWRNKRKAVPDGFEFMVKVAYKRKWVCLWGVTWAYVVHNVLSEHRKPKKRKRPVFQHDMSLETCE